MSGLSVLTSHTPELHRRKENFIELYSDYEEAAKGLQAMLSAPRNRGVIVGQSAEQSWSHKAILLESFIDKTQSVSA